ncbi:MAG: hypothetical protein DWP94_12805 [Flavobacterium sp.]|nr:MAG: hypothetical protein DWP94_12805 [Flavobacterium sp.]
MKPSKSIRMNDQLYSLLQRLLERNNIRLDREELKLQLVSHPSYPSLHALTGVLEHFRVPNAALKVPVNHEVLSNTPNHFLATLKIHDRDTLSLVERKSDRIYITNGDDKRSTLTIDEFLTQWSGIIVVIENESGIDSGKARFSGKLSMIILLTITLLLSAYIISNHTSWFSTLHFLLGLIGIGISSLILQHENGMNSGSLQAFCNLSQNTSCDAVLESKGASLTGDIKLSDLSLIFFASVAIGWLIGTQLNVSMVDFYALLGILTVPVVGYSVVYQAVIVKKWCLLCLGISCVLLLQVAFLLTGGSLSSSVFFDYKPALIFISSLLLSSALWLQIKPLIRNKSLLNKLKVEHFKFKRKFSLFNALYSQQTKISDIGSIPGELVFGKEQVPLKLILVTNPYCGFCKQAHRDMETLLRKAEGKINLTIRFLVDVNDPGSDIHLITSEILRIYNISGQEKAMAALNEVYADTANLAQWITEKGLEVNTAYDSILQSQKNWATENGINFTPALYLNNVQFPKEYERTDLLFFIDELVELLETQSTEKLQRQLAS